MGGHVPQLIKPPGKPLKHYTSFICGQSSGVRATNHIKAFSQYLLGLGRPINHFNLALKVSFQLYIVDSLLVGLGLP